MLDLIGLGAVAAAFFIAAASPGPATIAVATVSMSGGRARGLRYALGLSIGLAFWGLVAATGLGAILEASSAALFYLKIVGGTYLLWLAYGAARSATLTNHNPIATADGSAFSRGLFLNLSNPKAVLAWMAALALGLNNGSSIWQVVAATTLCIALGFAIYAAYAVIFSTRGAMDTYQRLRRWIESATAGLFALAGLGLIRSAFARQ